MLFQRELARFDLRQVEDGVDDLEQMIAGRFQLVEPPRLFGGQAGLPDQVGHAVDGVERGADFVRHVGEEGTLGHVGGLGGFLGQGQLRRPLRNEILEMFAVPCQLGFGELARGDVLDRAIEPMALRAGGIVLDPRDAAEMVRRAVAMRDAQFEIARLARL